MKIWWPNQTYFSENFWRGHLTPRLAKTSQDCWDVLTEICLRNYERQSDEKSKTRTGLFFHSGAGPTKQAEHIGNSRKPTGSFGKPPTYFLEYLKNISNIPKLEMFEMFLRCFEMSWGWAGVQKAGSTGTSIVAAWGSGLINDENPLILSKMFFCNFLKRSSDPSVAWKYLKTPQIALRCFLRLFDQSRGRMVSPENFKRNVSVRWSYFLNLWIHSSTLW